MCLSKSVLKILKVKLMISKEYVQFLSAVFLHHLSKGYDDNSYYGSYVPRQLTITRKELDKFGETLVERFCPCDKKHKRVKVKNSVGFCKNCGVRFYFRLNGLGVMKYKNTLYQFDVKIAENILRQYPKL